MKVCYTFHRGESSLINPPSGQKELTVMKFTFTDKKVTLPKSVHAYAEKKVGK